MNCFVVWELELKTQLSLVPVNKQLGFECYGHMFAFAAVQLPLFWLLRKLRGKEMNVKYWIPSTSTSTSRAITHRGLGLIHIYIYIYRYTHIKKFNYQKSIKYVRLKPQETQAQDQDV